MEMERICKKERLRSSVQDSWSKLWVPKIIAQARHEEESNFRLKKFLQDFPLNEDDGEHKLLYTG